MSARRDLLRPPCSCVSAILHRAGVPYCASCGAPLTLAASNPPARLYSQLDGERHPGCGRIKHLRIWRKARDAGDEGATTDGRARLLTPEAYARHAGASKPRAKALPRQEGAVSDALLDQLGATRRTGT